MGHSNIGHGKMDHKKVKWIRRKISNGRMVKWEVGKLGRGKNRETGHDDYTPECVFLVVVSKFNSICVICRWAIRGCLCSCMQMCAYRHACVNTCMNALICAYMCWCVCAWALFKCVHLYMCENTCWCTCLYVDLWTSLPWPNLRCVILVWPILPTSVSLLYMLYEPVRFINQVLHIRCTSTTFYLQASPCCTCCMNQFVINQVLHIRCTSTTFSKMFGREFRMNLQFMGHLIKQLASSRSNVLEVILDNINSYSIYVINYSLWVISPNNLLTACPMC